MDLTKITKRLERFQWQVEADMFKDNHDIKEIDDQAIEDLATLILYDTTEMLNQSKLPSITEKL